MAVAAAPNRWLHYIQVYYSIKKLTRLLPSLTSLNPLPTVSSTHLHTPLPSHLPTYQPTFLIHYLSAYLFT